MPQGVLVYLNRHPIGRTYPHTFGSARMSKSRLDRNFFLNDAINFGQSTKDDISRSKNATAIKHDQANLQSYKACRMTGNEFQHKLVLITAEYLSHRP